MKGFKILLQLIKSNQVTKIYNTVWGENPWLRQQLKLNLLSKPKLCCRSNPAFSSVNGKKDSELCYFFKKSI